jgi:hypothetical protein
VVTVRSYSCISGTTSDESDTGTSGSSSLAISRTRFSWPSLANELISETVSASMFFDFSERRLSRSAGSFERHARLRPWR